MSRFFDLLFVLSLACHASGGTLRLEASNPIITGLDQELPLFELITAKHVVPAVRLLLKKANLNLRNLEDAVSEPDFKASSETLLMPYQRISQKLGQAVTLVYHLHEVHADSAALRQALDEVRPNLVAFDEAVLNSKPIYAAFKALKQNTGQFHGLSPSQKKLVLVTLRDMELAGIGLEAVERSEFVGIIQQLSHLSNTYSENVLDSTKSWKKLIKSPLALKGLPLGALKFSAEAAKQQINLLEHSHSRNNSLTGVQQARTAPPPGAKVPTGPFLITLDEPSVDVVMSYAEDAKLREEVLLASQAVSSDVEGPDNTRVVKEILNLRHKQAQMLGYQNFAELSMQTKMATRDTAEKLLEDLRQIAYPKAKQELRDLTHFAGASLKNSSFKLEPWDVSFWSQKQVQALYDIDPEKLRPYFPLDRCLTGLFDLAGMLFDVRVEPVQGPVWHDDVRLFALFRGQSSKPTAHFYLDLFSRPGGKSSGAWQLGLIDFDAESQRRPVAAIMANFLPAIRGTEALLSFSELHTLFHEFGHALQTMLTTQGEPSMAGTSGVEWDAVELPSQFMEIWLDETDWVVESISGHFKTGEKLPAEKLNVLKAANKHHAAFSMLRQIYQSMLDLDVHTTPLTEGEAPWDRQVQIAIAKQTKVMRTLPEDRFLCHFDHIFDGGYAAGYYSYAWAEVLAADAFALFQERGAMEKTPEGLQQLRETGKHFANTVLAEGGGRNALEVFQSFRGRLPSTAPMLNNLQGMTANNKGGGTLLYNFGS